MHEHFLPQFYLRGWCRNGRLIRYEKRGGKVYTAPKFPAEVGYRPDLFDMPLQPDKPNWIEINHWQKIDNLTAPIFKKLVEDTPPRLTKDDYGILAAFLLALPIRTPWAQDHAVKVLKAAIAGEIPETEDAALRANDPELQAITDPDWVKERAIINTLEIATEPEKFRKLLGMNWHIWDLRRARRDLALADHALLISGSLNDPGPATLYLPINPKRLLIVTTEFQPRMEDNAVTQYINTRSATEAVEHIFAAHPGHKVLAHTHLKERDFRTGPVKYPNVPKSIPPLS